ncbi:MAG TPA: insulinase family protein, partial [Polyangiales bacterium]
MGVRVGFGRLSAWSAALFALVLWSPAARAEGATRAPTAHAIASYTLPNGLKVLLEEDHRQKLVAICVRYETGARDDPKGKRGLAHLVEHLTYRGSRHLKDGELATLFQRAGAADLGGETGFDATNFHATVSSSALPLALWLESERMAFSAEHFNAQSLSSELNIVHREEVLFSSSQRPLVLGTLTAMFGADHPYGAEGAEPADAKSLTLDDAREFFISGYRP